MIASAQHGISIGDEHLSVPLNRANQYFYMISSRQSAQHLSVQRTPLLNLNLHQLYSALCKKIHLCRRGHPQHPGNFRSSRHFRIHREAEPQLLPHKIQALSHFRAAHPGNRMLDAELLGNQAANNIDFIFTRNCDYKIRSRNAGFDLYITVNPVSTNAGNILRIGGQTQRVRIIINNHDIVTLIRQTSGKLKPHFTVADYDNSHTICFS